MKKEQSKLSKILNWNPIVSKKEGKFNIIGDNVYKFNRHIFWGASIILLVFLIYIFSSMNFDFSTRIYIKCDEDIGCNNPFFSGPINEDNILSESDKEKCVFDWCDNQTLPSGFEFGTKSPPLYNKAGFICWCIFFLALLLNHFLYNKGKIDKLFDGDNTK